MARKILSFHERQERAERNRYIKAGLTPPAASERVKGPREPAPPPVPNPNYAKYDEAVERLNKMPTYAGGEVLTGEQIEAICSVVEIGSFPHHAADVLGIPEGTWKAWMQKGKQGIEPYVYLFHAVKAARAKAINALVVQGRKAADGVAWQAVFRMLESFAADDWMRNERRIDEAGESYKALLNELIESRKVHQTLPGVSATPTEDRPLELPANTR